MHLCWNVPERMNLRTLTTAAMIAALAAACGGSTTSISEIAAPDAVRCQTSVATTPSTVPHSGSRVTLNVVADRECSWTARSEASWAQVTPSSGQGQGSLAVTVAANPDPSARSAAIVVNDSRLSLSQEAAPCRFQLGSSRNQLSHDGGRTAVSVTTSNGCAWRAASNAAWARVLTDSGVGSGTVEIEGSANPGGERTATISIADQSMVVVQDARPTEAPPPSVGAPPAPPPNPSCTITLDSSERSFGAAGGSGAIRVTAPPNCGWRATASASWVELSGASGTGTDTVGYRVAANTTTAARTATVTIGTRTHTVRQDALAVVGGGAGGGGGGGEEQRVELSGRVLFFEGSCPSIGFVLEGRRVFTNGDTRFRGGDCKNIGWGTEVRVEGRLQSDGRVRATEVRVRDDDD